MNALNIRGTKAIRVAYGEALAELGGERPDLVVLDADLAHATTTCVFGEKYPQRFFNLGIAEQNMMGVAAGLAISGLTPVASTFSIFGAGRAFEQVRNSICYPHLNVTLALTHNGLTVGEDGGSHQSIEDISLMRSIPGMTVLVPCDAIEARKATVAAGKVFGPCFLRFAREATPVFTEEGDFFEIGIANVLKQGTAATIIAAGPIVYEALQAHEQLAAEGISLRVINMHTIKPLDEAAVLAAARETGAIVTAEEAQLYGGLGGAVAEVLARKCPTPMEMVGIEDSFLECGTPEELAVKYGLTAKDLVRAVKKVMARK